MRKIIPAVAAGATALAVAGATFGYAGLNRDVTLSVDGQAADLTTTGGTVAEVLAEEGVTVTDHDVVAPALDAKVVDGTRIAVQFGREVTITVDGKPQSYWTTATSVGQALTALDIDAAGGDLSTSRSASIGRSGVKFSLATAKTVTVKVAGKSRRLETTAQTVGEALGDAKIKVDADDKLSTAKSTRLSDGASFSVTRVDVEKVTKKKKIDFETVYKDTDDLDQGETKIDTEGRPGVRTITYTEVRHNGKLQSREKTGSEVTREPVDAVVLRGTREPEPAEEPSSDSGGSSSGSGGSGAWDRLAQCESGGNWAINTGNGYSGGLQFSASTWRAYGGSGMPHQASRAQQIAIAEKVRADVGFSAWPACSSKLGLR